MTARRYTAVEIVGALVVFTIFMHVAIMAVGDLRRARERFVGEQRALLVLDNTVEQLAARERTTPEEARELLAHELDAAGLAPGLTAVVNPGEEHCELAIRDARDRTVVHVRVGLE